MAFKINNKYLYSTAFDGTSDKSSPVMPFAKTDGTFPIVNSSVTTCLAPPPACSPTSSLGSGTARRFMSNRDGDVATADVSPFTYFRKLQCDMATGGSNPNGENFCLVSLDDVVGYDGGEYGGVSSTTNFVDPNNTSNFLLPPIQCQSSGSRKLSNLFHGWAESDYARNWLGINGPLGGPRADPVGTSGSGHGCRDFPDLCKGSLWVTPWGYKKYSAEMTSFYTHSVGDYVETSTGNVTANKCCGTITNGSVMWRNCFHNATNFLWQRWTSGYGVDSTNSQVTPARFESGCGSMAVDGGSPFAAKRFMTRISVGRWAPGYQVRQNWSGCWQTTDETSIDGVTSSPSQILPDNSYITGCHDKGSNCLNSGNFSSYSWHGENKLYDQWNNCSATNSWAVGQQSACADGTFDGDWIFPHCYHWHDPAPPKGFHVGIGFEADFSDICSDRGCASQGGMYGMMANSIMLENQWNLTFATSYPANVDFKYWNGNLCSSGGCCSLGKVPHSGTFSQTANITFNFQNNDACSGITSIAYS
tara:strand:+ start:42 stop:1637 length:1596 start_codon:yes stop_codon:yes gene_type:complete